MAARVTSWWSLPGLLRALFSQVRLSVRLLREPRVSRLAKLVPLLSVLYVIVPLDFVPDILPLLGQIDDLGILVVALEVFLKLCPVRAVTFHRAAIEQGRRYSRMPAAEGSIDAEWRRQE